MKNSEKGKFEGAWQKAFENAEQTPSDKVWTGLEQGLSNSEMKRKVVFYQRLAAAAVLFALILGGVTTYYATRNSAPEEIALAEPVLPIQEEAAELTSKNEVDNSIDEKLASTNLVVSSNEDGTASANQNENRFSETPSAKASRNALRQNTSISTFKNIHESESHGLQTVSNTTNYLSQIQARNYPSQLNSLKEPEVKVKGEARDVTIVRILPAMPASLMTSRKDKRTEENLWASLNATTGSYSPSGSFNTASTTSFYQNSAVSSLQSNYSTNASKGSAYSFGMNVGKRISDRWVLQGGLSYLNQAIGYTSNTALMDANNNRLASVADYGNKNAENTNIVTLITPYEVNSVNQFISIPLQAGYLLIDRKIGFQLNSGVATDFFVLNTLTDKSGQLEKFSEGPGEFSPYRSLNWSGLMSSELSYKLGKQYRVSLAPGLRYSFSPVLKSVSNTSAPLVWDLGFRFRYIFN